MPTEQTCHFLTLLYQLFLLLPSYLTYTIIFFLEWICYVSKKCISALLERYNCSRLSQAKSELKPQEKGEVYDFYIIKVFF